MDHLYGENQNVPPERTLNFGENGTQNRTQAYPEVPKRTQYWDQERLIFGYKWVPLGTILGSILGSILGNFVICLVQTYHRDLLLFGM